MRSWVADGRSPYNRLVLANLLPGFRELRTPLASGYIWLVILWLVLGAKLQSGPLKDLYETSQFLGQSVLLGVLSFLAFLIGSLLQIRIVRDGGRLRRYGRRRNPTPPQEVQSMTTPPAVPSAPPRRQHGSAILSWVLNYRELYDLYSQLERFIGSNLDPRTESDLSPERKNLALFLSEHNERLTRGAEFLERNPRPDASEAPLRQLYIEALSFELDPIAIRLQATNENLWDTYDRHCAEEQFRYTVAVPLAFLVPVVAWQSGEPAWLAALILPILLFIHGLRHSASATSVLVQAIVLGIVKADALASLDSVATEKPSSGVGSGRGGGERRVAPHE